MGTPYYMAPELVNQPGSTNSDIYALGVVLYEMLTGRVPFEGRTPIAICLKHLREPLTLPSSLNPQVSPALDQVLLSALAKTPGLRFSTPLELAAAYWTALAHPEMGALPQRPNLAVASITTSSIVAVRTKRQKTTYARLAATGAVLFTLGLASLGIFYPGGSSVPASRAAQMASVPATHTPTVPTPLPKTTHPSTSTIHVAPDGKGHHGHSKHHGHIGDKGDSGNREA